jgi:hypothetical protein
MNTYNKIMLYFWAIMGTFILVFISYMSYTEGLKKWGFYYIFVFTSYGMFFFKKWMVKRMHKHLEFLEEKRKNTPQDNN